ncbi:MAG: hypothetical protein NW224_21225 [Leptolyngbyaceae cyanobacterium bins.302]|nr:hypothetical protein [Leptolyngbyaceae cyanobacterium bins.302]
MDKLLRHRRHLLYLGLGLAGVGVATAFGVRSRQADLDTASLDVPPATHPVLTSSSGATTALAANSKPLPEFQGISQWLNSALVPLSGET